MAEPDPISAIASATSTQASCAAPLVAAGAHQTDSLAVRRPDSVTGLQRRISCRHRAVAVWTLRAALPPCGRRSLPGSSTSSRATSPQSCSGPARGSSMASHLSGWSPSTCCIRRWPGTSATAERAEGRLPRNGVGRSAQAPITVALSSESKRDITSSGSSSTLATSRATAANTSADAAPPATSVAARRSDSCCVATNASCRRMSSSARKRSSMSLNATTAPRPSSMSIGVEVRLVAVAPEHLVGAPVARRRDRRGVREAAQALGSTTQTGCATVCMTAARKFSAPTFQPPRSVREPGTRSYEPDPGQRHRQDCGRHRAATARRAGITPGNKLSATKANSEQLERALDG